MDKCLKIRLLFSQPDYRQRDNVPVQAAGTEQQNKHKQPDAYESKGNSHYPYICERGEDQPGKRNKRNQLLKKNKTKQLNQN